MPTSSSRVAFKLVGGSSSSEAGHKKAQMIKDIRKVFLCCVCVFVAVVPARAQQAKQFVDDGLAAFDRGDTSAARAAFEKALALKADEVTAHTYLGIIADRAGDLKRLNDISRPPSKLIRIALR